MVTYWQSAVNSTYAMLVVTIYSFIISSVAVGAIFLFVGRVVRWSKSNKISIVHAIFFGFPFSVLGVTVGFVTSISRDAAVGAVLPAILGLVGGICIYLVSKGGRAAIISVVSVVMLCVAFSAGIGYGARARVENEQMALSRQSLVAAADREAFIKQYRRVIGLDADSSGGVTSKPVEPSK